MSNAENPNPGEADSPPITREPLALLLSAWLVPGLGHFLFGDRKRGIRMGVLIFVTFFAGLAVSDFEAVAPQIYKISYYAQIGAGTPALLLTLIDPAAEASRIELAGPDTPRAVPRFTDLGLLFCNVAGILNILLIFDLLDRRFSPSRRGSVAT